jgi:hypothetical protein
LVPVFQLPEPGLSNQTASTASTWVDVATNSNTATSVRIEAARMPFLTGWVVILISCVFMGTVAIEVERGCVATLLVAPKGGSMIGNLDHRSEQTENEPVQSTDLRTRRTPARLAFADHMNRLVAGDRTPSSPE